MFSPNFGNNQSGVWGFFFKMIKNSSLFFLRKLQSYINLHQVDALSGMLWCVCVCVCVHVVCVYLSHTVLQKEEKQNEIRQPCSTWHVENERVRSGGVGTTWSSSLLFIAQGNSWWSQTYFTGETPQPNGSMHFDVYVQWRLLWDGGKQEEADGGQQSLFVPPPPLNCRSTLWGQKTGCSFNHLLNRPDPSVIGPFIQPSVCLLILLTLHRSHSSFFPSASVSFLCCFLGISHKQTEQLGMTHRFLGK